MKNRQTSRQYLWPTLTVKMIILLRLEKILYDKRYDVKEKKHNISVHFSQ